VQEVAIGLDDLAAEAEETTREFTVAGQDQGLTTKRPVAWPHV
jgi:hypothetical protein